MTIRKPNIIVSTFPKCAAQSLDLVLRRVLEDIGYDGFCEVEIFSKENWWKRDPEEVLDVCVERFKRVC